MVDGRSTVEELVDRSPLGEFDTYRLLYELLNRNLVAEVRSTATLGIAHAAEAAGGLSSRLLTAVVLVAAAATVATLPANPVTPWKIVQNGKETDLLKTYASRSRMERIERALEIFYLDLGTIPADLESLAERRYLGPADLADPWGRSYRYELGRGGYRLAGSGPDGAPREELTLTHRFSAAERLILEGGAVSRGANGVAQDP